MRSMYDRNTYEITPDGVWIDCYNRKQEISGRFLIDEADLEKVIPYKWRYWQGRFFTGNYKPISIHQFLLGQQDGLVIDHINGNPADNRRCNLRVITQGNNVINKSLLNTNTSGVMGISWDKDRNRWAVEIHYHYKRCHLGRYVNFEDAVYVRYVAENALFGEFRPTRNEPIIFENIEKCSNKESLKNYTINKLKEKELL